MSRIMNVASVYRVRVKWIGFVVRIRDVGTVDRQ